MKLLCSFTGRICLTIRKPLRSHKPAMLCFGHFNSSMVEKNKAKGDSRVTPLTNYSPSELEVQGPMRHLLKGQEKITKIQRVSIFRGQVEQSIDKRDIIAFESALEEDRSKEGFVRVVNNFLDKDRLRRGHLSFVYTALYYVDAFGLEKDVDVYNEILEAFPKYKIVNRTLLDALWPKPHPQIDAALDLLTKMEDNGIRPDDLTYTILLEVFGKASFPAQKAQRMAYWFDKYKDSNPHLLSEEDLKDRYKVCELALKRISMGEDIKVYQCEVWITFLFTRSSILADTFAFHYLTVREGKYPVRGNLINLHSS